MKRLLSMALAVLLLLSLSACKQAKTVPGPTESDPVLAARRDDAEAFMRQMCTVLWTPEEDILYTTQSSTDPSAADPNKQFLLKAGRTYRGIPYSFAGSTTAAFLEYSTGSDASGIHTISDLPWQALSGNSHKARIGTDGSSALILSWGQLGANIPLNSSPAMTQKRGFMPVGGYANNPTKIEKTIELCATNGTAVMYNAYAQMMKADGLVANTETGGHSMMVVSVSITYNEDGTINGDESYVTVLEQTKDYFLEEETYEDPDLGQVYIIAGVDVKYTFAQLYETGHLPITCQALTDVSQVRDIRISQTNSPANVDEFFQGYVDSNYYIDSLIATVYDQDGKVVQECAVRTARSDKRQIEIAQIQKDTTAGKRGAINLAALSPGAYQITLTCRLANGHAEILREMPFSIKEPQA